MVFYPSTSFEKGNPGLKTAIISEQTLNNL